MSRSEYWNYILVFNDGVGSLDSVKTFIDSCPDIITWYICMSHAIFIRSALDANDITDLFRSFTQDEGRFVVLDCDTDRNGWLPKKAWQFMRNEYP